MSATMKGGGAVRRVRMLDLAAEYDIFREDIRNTVDSVLESQQFIGGPAVREFEEAMCARVGVRHAVAVSSGTDALLCAMMALGIGAGDEVILPAFTFFATAGSVARLGAVPVFAEIDPKTFNIDPSGIESLITDKTRAVAAVHLFGQCAEMQPIRAVAENYGLPVMEDAAQAIGASQGSVPACRLGHIACLSFYPTKNLGGFGEGGMVLTDDDTLGSVARQLRVHGESKRYIHERVGGNFRLDTMKAAILLVKLRDLDDFNAQRRAHAALYDQLLTDIPVTTPYVAEGNRHVYHQYTVLCDRRDDLASHLRERGVDTGVYYPVPLHLQACFAPLGYTRGSLPVTENISDRVLSFPCHPMMSDADVAYVASCVAEFYGAPGEQAAPRTDTESVTSR